MKFKFWKELTEEEKEKLLKRICGVAAVIFVIILLLMLMKCQGCSSGSRGRDFADGRGHAYGEKFSGNGLFDNEYGNGADDYTSLDENDSVNGEGLKQKTGESEKEAEEAAE